MRSCGMGWSAHGRAHDTFALASALVASDFESARGAFLTCLALHDPEWSHRAAVVLGDLLRERGDAHAAEPLLRTAVDSRHPEWAAHAGIVLGIVLAPRGERGRAWRVRRRRPHPSWRRCGKSWRQRPTQPVSWVTRSAGECVH